jgi:hypothetical protein
MENGETKTEVVAAPAVASVVGKLDKPYQLRKAITLNDGRVVSELSLDVDKLDMSDFHSLEMEYGAIWPGASPTNGIFMTDQKYQAMMIARINGMNYDQVSKVRGVDAVMLYREFSSFLANPV